MSRAQYDIQQQHALNSFDQNASYSKFINLEGKSAALMRREFDFYGLNIRMH